MLLQSASNAKAVSMPSSDRGLMLRFLDSVATGREGGLATYRPRMGNYQAAEQATHSMTAEAMASRLLLGFPVRTQAAAESQRMLLSQLPGQGQDNFYYWYYATLALYQLREVNSGAGGSTESDFVWQQWNDALKKQLCSTQVSSGPDKGSWNPTCIWGQEHGSLLPIPAADQATGLLVRHRHRCERNRTLTSDQRVMFPLTHFFNF
jgi:hypothetical protein